MFRTHGLWILGLVGTVLSAQDARGPTLRGRIVDVAGNGIPAAEVWISGADGEVCGRTRADGSGSFAMPRPARRAGLSLHARAEGCAEDRVPLDLDAGDDVADLALVPAVPLRGRITAGEGRPAAGAEVVVRAPIRHGSRAVDWSATCRTDADGNWSLPAVPAQSLQVGAWLGGHRPQTVRCRPEDGHAVDLVLAPCALPAQRVRVTGLAAGATATIVARPLTMPTSDGPVFPAALYEVPVAADGVIEVSGLPIDHTIQVLAPGHDIRPLRVHCDADRARELEFDLTPRAAADAGPAVALHGTLVDELGHPLPRRTAYCSDHDGKHRIAFTTADDGSFAITAPVSPDTLCRFALPPGTMRMGHPHAELGTGGITWWSVSATKDAPIKLHARRTATLAGVTADAAGVPQAGAVVEIWLQRNLLLRTRSDSDGRFSVPGLPAGRYDVRFRDHTDRQGAASVVLGDDGVAEVGAFAYEPAGVVTGTVRDETGRPLAGVTVWLGPDRSAPAPRRGALPSLTFAARTDLAGRYRLRGVPAGRWSIASETMTPLRGDPVEVEADATSVADLTAGR